MNGARWRDVASPESIASVLVGLIAVALIATQALAGVGSPPAAGRSPSPSVRPSASPTMDPSVRNALATALIVNQSLAGRIADLRAVIEVEAPSAADIAAVLRSVNADLTIGREASGRLLLADETEALGRDLDAFYDAVAARTNETLGTSIRNTQAYVDGAVAVIDLLAGLGPLDDRLADALARRAPPTVSAAPTGPPSPTPAPPSPSPSPSVAPPPTVAPPSASAAPVGLVPNGGFEDGLTGWQLVMTDGAEATVAHEPGAGPDGSAAARVDIATGSAARSGVSLISSSLPMDQGVTYVVEVAVRAASARELRVRLIDGNGQTTIARVFQVTTAWQVVRFDAKQLLGDPDVRVGLDLGRSDATVWFDQVVVRQAAAP
ncbi:MAG TPA: carbohydrate binding domain-containing protein [Candidatus Limnocylindrales bacterium]|nr:carbohydrate binding domain-containing protein [Candidatus Limnocylindrales bacterium]